MIAVDIPCHRTERVETELPKTDVHARSLARAVAHLSRFLRDSTVRSHGSPPSSQASEFPGPSEFRV